MKYIKTIKGYTALSRFISTLRTKSNGDLYIAGYMPANKMPKLSPYVHSPSYAWYRMTDKEQSCIKWIETSHNTYEVWKCETQEDFQSLVNESEATQEYLNSLKGK